MSPNIGGGGAAACLLVLCGRCAAAVANPAVQKGVQVANSHSAMLERRCICSAEGPGKLKVPLNFQELQHLRDVLQLYKQVDGTVRSMIVRDALHKHSDMCVVNAPSAACSRYRHILQIPAIALGTTLRWSAMCAGVPRPPGSAAWQHLPLPCGLLYPRLQLHRAAAGFPVWPAGSLLCHRHP